MILRALFPLVALVVAGLSIVVGRLMPLPEDEICRYGVCGHNQMYSSVAARGATPATFVALLEQDPSNPHVWANYGDYLAMAGHIAAAQQAFAQAAAIGPGLAPVLMRVANFEFTHDRTTEALALVPRILRQTSAYDEILFAYLGRLRLEPAQMLGSTIPASPRTGRSWLAWTLNHSTTEDAMATWVWLQREGLADQRSATDTVNTLWRHAAYHDAQQVWMDWRGVRTEGYPQSQLLDDPRFEAESSATPFGWTMTPQTGLEYSRGDGLEIRFLGQSNLTDPGVRQHAVVSPGKYRFVADVSAEAISTDEGVFFLIIDAEDPNRLRVSTVPITGTLARTSVTLDLAVTDGTRVVRVTLARKASLKFDNKVAGVLRVYRLALVRSGFEDSSLPTHAASASADPRP
jgi:hypothetical protein